MSTLRCFDAWGNGVEIAAEAVNFCPAVYGLFIERGQVLLQRHALTELWHPPGTILQTPESPSQTLCRYFRQIAGLVLVVGPLLFVEEQYHVDRVGEAWHLSMLYYVLERSQTSQVALAYQPTAAQTQMIPLNQLERVKLQFGFDAIQAGCLRLALQQ